MHTGSVFGGVLLIAGCCIGAGMLGVPVLSAMAGFMPSIVMFGVAWLYMIVTALLLLEVTLWFPKESNIVTMAQQTLGKLGKFTAWSVFLFLFYCLMVAYISGCGALLTDMTQLSTGYTLPPAVGSILFTLLLACLLYAGTKTVDHFNRLFMLGLIITYIGLIVLGAPHIQIDFLNYAQWTPAIFLMPIMIVSFGFHNLIPSLSTYLNHDYNRLKKTVIIGSLIPLAIYIAWEALILGLIPIQGEGGLRQTLNEGQLATHALKNVSGSGWVVDLAQFFAFFALITSFLGVGLSFFDFLSDGLKIKKSIGGKLLLCGLVLFPPLFFALGHPHVFLAALNYAGGIGAVILFGILPALMVWYGRNKKLEKKQLVPGGKVTLGIVLALSLAVIGLQLWS